MRKDIRVIKAVFFEKCKVLFKKGINQFTLIIKVDGLPDAEIKVFLTTEIWFINNRACYDPTKLFMQAMDIRNSLLSGKPEQPLSKGAVSDLLALRYSHRLKKFPEREE